MCVGIVKDEMMGRIDPERHETEVERRGCRTMDFTKKFVKGYVLIDKTGMQTREDFEHWINLCLEFNPQAKASKRIKENTDKKEIGTRIKRIERMKTD